MSTPNPPLPADAVDELLSAELDGDLEAAAAGLGLTVDEAGARLAATPGVADRRRALARARDEIAVRPELPPESEERFVAAALAGTDEVAAARDRRERQTRNWRVLVAASSVAAAIVVIVGVSTARDNGDASKVASKPAAIEASGDTRSSDGTAATNTGPTDFGDVTRLDRLQALVHTELRDSAASEAGVPAPAKSTTAYDAAPGTTEAPGQVTAGKSAGNDAAPHCLGAARRQFGVTSPPVVDATGTVSGRPVEILVFRFPEGPVAYVLAAGDCTIVRKQPLA